MNCTAESGKKNLGPEAKGAQMLSSKLKESENSTIPVKRGGKKGNIGHLPSPL